MDVTRDAQDTRSLGVLVVDDHRTFADLVSRALDAEAGLHCLGTATTGAEAIAAIAQTAPDVILMDVDLGGEHGIDVTRDILARWPALPVVVLTGQADAAVMHAAAAAGACALVAKNGALDDLLDAIRAAHVGGMYVHPDLLVTLVGTERRTPVRVVAPELTPRESDVLHELARGQQVAQIARRLGMSVHTCRGHVKSILAKLGAHSQLEAVVVAGSLGLIHGQSPP
ncbi:response regulator transcription factor [Alteromonas gracilis]